MKFLLNLIVVVGLVSFSTRAMDDFGNGIFSSLTVGLDEIPTPDDVAEQLASKFDEELMAAFSDSEEINNSEISVSPSVKFSSISNTFRNTKQVGMLADTVIDEINSSIKVEGVEFNFIVALLPDLIESIQRLVRRNVEKNDLTMNEAFDYCESLLFGDLRYRNPHKVLALKIKAKYGADPYIWGQRPRFEKELKAKSFIVSEILDTLFEEFYFEELFVLVDKYFAVQKKYDIFKAKKIKRDLKTVMEIVFKNESLRKSSIAVTDYFIQTR